MVENSSIAPHSIGSVYAPSGAFDTPLDAEELYTRYKEWFPFAHRLYTFVHRVSEDLAYEEGKELDYKEMKIS